MAGGPTLVGGVWVIFSLVSTSVLTGFLLEVFSGEDLAAIFPSCFLSLLGHPSSGSFWVAHPVGSPPFVA